MVIYRKLFDIDRYGHKKALLKRKPLFKFNKEVHNAYKKNEIIKVAQENLFMLKRLREQTSCYNNKKWRDDYLKSQSYKNYICEFRPINFNTYNKKIRSSENKMQLTEYTKPNKFYKTISCSIKKNKKNKLRKRFEEFDYREFLDEEDKKKYLNKKEKMDDIYKKEEDVKYLKTEDNKIGINRTKYKIKSNSEKKKNSKIKIKPIKMKGIFELDINNDDNINKEDKNKNNTIDNN